MKKKRSTNKRNKMDKKNSFIDKNSLLTEKEEKELKEKLKYYGYI